MEPKWGILGPEFLPNSRRVRTLGLGETVRSFNDLAVPGLGGVWYCKQLMLAALGVAVTEEAQSRGARVQNIEVANAIEALACWLAFNSNGWRNDARLRGNTKLRGVVDFSFKRARQRNFYVTQPMRMATTQALPALGFVDSDSARFNAFQCSDSNRTVVEEFTKAYRPHKRGVIDHLARWVLGESDKLKTDELRLALSPLIPLSDQAMPLLRERLIQGGKESPEDKERRCKALAWVETLRNAGPVRALWRQRPDEISEKHWKDLHAGAMFFEARDAAIAVLNAAETYIGNQKTVRSLSTKARLPQVLVSELEKLISAATNYLAFGHADADAKEFCSECVKDSPVSILRSLVYRDQIVLRIVGDEIKPGPAFRGSVSPGVTDEGDLETPKASEIPLPVGVSYRMRNLYLLNLDMHGELDQWLKPSTSEEEA
jgi:hypothetical protein